MINDNSIIMMLSRVRKDDIYVSVLDLIRSITGGTSSSAQTKLRGMLKSDAFLSSIITSRRLNEKGVTTPVVSSGDHADYICTRVIAGLRKSTREKQAMAEKHGVSGMLHVMTPVECDYMDILEDAFRAYDPRRQYRVGGYRVDLYLRIPRIVIECDEDGHKAYCQQREMQREAHVRIQTGSTFVRFDPYERGFRFGRFIAKIMGMIQEECA